MTHLHVIIFNKLGIHKVIQITQYLKDKTFINGYIYVKHSRVITQLNILSEKW